MTSSLPLLSFFFLNSPLSALHHSPVSSSRSRSSLSGSLYRLLLELLELLFDKFKAVAQAHSVALAHLQQIAVQGGAHEEGIKLYEQADVSAKIQTVLQVKYATVTQTIDICALCIVLSKKMCAGAEEEY